MPSPRSLSLGAVGVLAAFVALAVSERSGYAQPVAFGDAAGSAEPAGRAVVVIPFANVSARPEDDWLGVGIAETVVSGVERLGYVTVVDRHSLFGGAAAAAANPPGDEAWARDRARAAGVSWLVGGGFQRVDDQVRIIARVTDVETGAPLEFARVDGRADDLFVLQDRIVAEVADGLARLVGPGAASVADVRRPVARESGGRGMPNPGARGAMGGPPAVAGGGSGGRFAGGRSRGPFDAAATTPAAGTVGVRGGGGSGGPFPAARLRDSLDGLDRNDASPGGGGGRFRARRAGRRRRRAHRPGDGAAAADHDPAGRRRPPRRRGLEQRGAHHRVRSARAAGRCPRDRGHRRLPRVRRVESVSGLSCQVRQHQHHAREPRRPRPGGLRRRHDLGLLRHVPRPAARLRVLRERLRGAGRFDRGRPGGRLRWLRRRGPRRDPARRPVVGCPVRERRPARRGRVHGRDGDSVQEPAVPRAARRRPPHVGLPDRPPHPGQGRDRRVVAGVAGHRRVPAADGRPRRDDGPLDEPEPGGAADVHRVPLRHLRRDGGTARRRRAEARLRGQLQVRRDPQPHRRLHLQPRLLADRVGPASGRGEPALRPLLPRAAPVLPGGGGDLPDAGAGHRGAHADHRRPAVRGQADRQGRQDHPGGPVRQRRGGQPGRGRPSGPRVRPVGADLRGPRPLRPLLRVVRGRRSSPTGSSSTGTAASSGPTATSASATPTSWVSAPSAPTGGPRRAVPR